jgi:hypothetical protein
LSAHAGVPSLLGSIISLRSPNMTPPPTQLEAGRGKVKLVALCPEIRRPRMIFTVDHLVEAVSVSPCIFFNRFTFSCFLFALLPRSILGN